MKIISQKHQKVYPFFVIFRQFGIFVFLSLACCNRLQVKGLQDVTGFVDTPKERKSLYIYFSFIVYFAKKV